MQIYNKLEAKGLTKGINDVCVHNVSVCMCVILVNTNKNTQTK